MGDGPGGGLASIVESPAWRLLNELDQAIVRMFYEGRSHREIGTALDVSETRVLAALRR